MERTDIDAFITAWCETWDLYGRNQTSGGARLAFKALADLGWDAVRAALNAHVQEQPKDPPTPAAIRERIYGDPSERAQHAWGKLRRAIQRVGPYQSIAFDDALIHCAIRDMGGWVRVNEWTLDEVPFRQRDFERAYRAYVRVQSPAYPPHLPGIAEGHNSAEGHAVQPPVLIGDVASAQRVIAQGVEAKEITRQTRRESGHIAQHLPSHLLAAVGGES